MILSLFVGSLLVGFVVFFLGGNLRSLSRVLPSMMAHSVFRRAGVPTAFVVCMVSFLLGCPAQGDQVRPPSDELFFVTSLHVTPDDSVLFVTNGNSDLRYDSGALVVVDLELVEDVLQSWVTSGSVTGDCFVDSTRPEVQECKETQFMRPEQGVRIGNFATDVTTQVLADGNLRVFAAVRGDPSITWADYDAGEGLVCENSSSSFPLCDSDHRIVRVKDDAELPALLDEPFLLFNDSQNEYLLSSHLSTGSVSLFSTPADGSEPQLVDAVAGLFAGDSSGRRGSVGIAGRQPGTASDLIYATSRSENRVQLLYVDGVGSGNELSLVPSEFFFLDWVSPSNDTRGLQFNAAGDRGYVLSRAPASVQVIDTSLDSAGFPRNEVVSAVEVCEQAADMQIADFGRGTQVYVSCFSDGELWVVDPQRESVTHTIEIGRGPSSIAVSRNRRRVYVSNFLEDTIAVVDAEPGSVTQNQFLLRIGIPKQTEGTR